MDLSQFSRPVQMLWKNLSSCTLCPRQCGVNRLKGQNGYCGAEAQPIISSFGPHFGEESVLVGRGGSGTVFFTGCNLRCIYCQNYDISWNRRGEEISIVDLSKIFLHLQKAGCININLVTPTHQIAAIAASLETAKKDGLSVPVVYNTGGYDSLQTLRLLDGLVDIYMPDMKYADANIAARLSDVTDYPQVNQAAVLEMHRQVGDLQTVNGVATRGLLIRHLVLPADLAGSEQIFDFLARQVSARTAIHVMDQYRPCFQVDGNTDLNRQISSEEWIRAVSLAKAKGLFLVK